MVFHSTPARVSVQDVLTGVVYGPSVASYAISSPRIFFSQLEFLFTQVKVSVSLRSGLGYYWPVSVDTGVGFSQSVGSSLSLNSGGWGPVTGLLFFGCRA
ncbi:unnamed protein product [Brassica napus]|uniref:(rape) hypothetical protein n=1 Tax=Brassica napus TaxID=3708 RepID=A0A816UW62_BRANA|nr:unnamed protein product [Brassica napus]